MLNRYFQQHYDVPGRTVAAANIAVFGIYPNRPSVEYGLTLLRHAGFRRADVSVLFPEYAGMKNLAMERNIMAQEDGMSVSASGGSIPGEFSWVGGREVLSVPGLGPLVAAGPIVAAFASLSEDRGAGAVVNALMTFGVSESKARRYERRILDGAILLSVHCGNVEAISWARELLSASGAEEISTAG